MPSEWCDMPFSTGVATEILLLPVSPHVPCSFLSHPSSVLYLSTIMSMYRVSPGSDPSTASLQSASRMRAR